MHRLQGSQILVCLFFILVFTRGDEGGDHGSEEQRKRPTLSEMLRGCFALFGTASSPWLRANHLGRFKLMINQLRPRFSPPNLDFRGGDEARDVEGVGAGEKTKEAVTRSIEKGKETLEDSAKSAAKIASEAVQKTKEKVERTISDHGKTQPPSHGEL